MALYAIADLHLSLSGDKPMDVFPGWEGYTQRMPANWNKLVGQDDTVVIPGDVSWAMDLNSIYEDFRYIDSLPGKKILIRGNHDFWWSTRKKIETYLAENGFNSISILQNDSVRVGDIAVCGTRGWKYSEDMTEEDKKIFSRELIRLEMSLGDAVKKGGEPVCFMHYPPVFTTLTAQPVVDLLKKYGVRRCFYGHLHGDSASFAFQGIQDGIEYRLVSADSIGFTPYLVDKLS
ncbi:MAG: metallophosphoesterase [Oscillospiraceae bacterium]|jgi:predicted phosphohydrolase